MPTVFFELPNESNTPEEEEQLVPEEYPRTGELFYYQTSSSSPSPSNSHASSVSDHSEQDHHPRLFQADHQVDAEDEEQTSPFEYEA